MYKKLLMTLVCFVTIIVSGCSCSLSKGELIEKNVELLDKIEGIKEESSDLYEAMNIIKFYNILTTETMNAFVLVEGKNFMGSNKKYSNGIIIGSNGQDMYVLTDYSAIYMDLGRYTVMDSYANSFLVSDVYVSDSATGLAVLKYSTSNSLTTSVKVGDTSSVFAHLDSMEQLNKATILENIKSSTIEYNSTTYTTHYLENTTLNNGAIFINNSNEVMGIYASKVNAIITKDLLKVIIDFI